VIILRQFVTPQRHFIDHLATGLLLFGIALFWISTTSATTPYLRLAATVVVGGGGLGMITAPATESIMGAVPKEKAGVGSAVNDATRLFGAALGVAVIGSIAASLYSARLAATVPSGLPSGAAAAAKGSVGGALVPAQTIAASGFTSAGRALAVAGLGAFLHSFAGALRVASVVALAGSAFAAAFLPSRPRVREGQQASPLRFMDDTTAGGAGTRGPSSAADGPLVLDESGA
jgi:hypothetical protein